MFESFQLALDEGLNILYVVVVCPLKKVSEDVPLNLRKAKSQETDAAIRVRIRPRRPIFPHLAHTTLYREDLKREYRTIDNGIPSH